MKASGWSLAGVGFLGFLASTGSLLAAATPTPTPRPRLSGGFGRPRATPAAAASSDGGQSLTDVVRAAQGSRAAGSGDGSGHGSGQKEKSSVTIDNRSLVKDSEKGRLTTSSLAAAKPPAPKATPKAEAAAKAQVDADGDGDGGEVATAAADASGTGGGEAEWKEIARRDRKRVEDAKARVGELTATSKKLENDFYAWDDGQYRDRVIKPAWDRAKADLDQARIDLAAAEKELADLPEKARKAGAPPGWIRE